MVVAECGGPSRPSIVGGPSRPSMASGALGLLPVALGLLPGESWSCCVALGHGFERQLHADLDAVRLAVRQAELLAVPVQHLQALARVRQAHAVAIAAVFKILAAGPVVTQ